MTLSDVPTRAAMIPTVIPIKDLPEQRVRLFDRVQHRWPRVSSHDELMAHFQAMPDRYWQQVTEDELVADIAAVHAFLCRLTSHAANHPQVAVVWRHAPEQGWTRVRVCTWNRQGLLAKVVAAFSALRLNILRAEVYTRSDDVVLDVFDVCDSTGRHVSDGTRLDGIAFLIEGALREPPRFASVWSAEFHKLLPAGNEITPRITFDSGGTATGPTICVEASDRPGLLYDVLQAMTGCQLSILQAVVTTVAGVAHDEFQVAGPARDRTLDLTMQEQIRQAVTAAIQGSKKG